MCSFEGGRGEGYGLRCGGKANGGVVCDCMGSGCTDVGNLPLGWFPFGSFLFLLLSFLIFFLRSSIDIIFLGIIDFKIF